MKTIKTLVGIAIINIVVVYFLSGIALVFSGKNAKAQTDSGILAPVSIQLTPTITLITAETSESTPSKAPKTAPKVAQQGQVIETSAPTSTPDTRCIIVVDGSQYNVTQLRSTHSGGDIFTCQTDMSVIFWSQHNQDIFQKIQKYRI